ncbi:MAG TPA: oxygenase MpaB family protein [Mycobacterium sp.]|nr:oxygenase MpaB family protein [Mycobacterium sp.]
MTAELAEQLPPVAPTLVPDGVGLADFVGEFFVLLGAGATVLLQMAEPGVGHGVADHSLALRLPLNRLRTTMSYVYAVTMGTPEEKRAIVKLVNKAHVPVRSETYNAFDPELQLWVAATLYKNGVDLYERFFGAMDERTADRIYQQSAVYGTALQVKPEMWPATRAEFDEYWAHKLDTLQADDQVRDFVYGLMHGGEAPWFIQIGMPLNRFFTAGLLPERLRGELGLSWSPTRQRAFEVFMTVVPPVYRLVPGPIRRLPSTYYLWDMRKRLRSGRGIA